VILGVVLFSVCTNHSTHQLNDSMRDATMKLLRAARIRELEQGSVRGHLIDAVDELNIPDRVLYLLDLNGQPVKPAKVDAWITQAARQAGRTGQITLQRDTRDDKTLRLHAIRFKLASGQHLVADPVADQDELEDRYADLIAALVGIALVARALVRGGGFRLVPKSPAPICP